VKHRLAATLALRNTARAILQSDTTLPSGTWPIEKRLKRIALPLVGLIVIAAFGDFGLLKKQRVGVTGFAAPLNLAGTSAAIHNFATGRAAPGLNRFLYVDDTHSSSPDLGATLNAMVAALPSTGGAVSDNSPTPATILTTVSDGGKTVKFEFGAVNITCAVQCIHITSQGSSVEGAGDSSRFTASGSLSASVSLIYVDGTAGGPAPYDHTIKGLNLIQGRNSRVGLLKANTGVKTNISDILADGTPRHGYKMIGIELWNGFAESVRNVRCVNSASSICVGITAPDTNVSNESVQDMDVFNMTAVATNYAPTAAAPTLTDGTHILNAQVSGATGQVAKQGVTTVSGSNSPGTALNVASGSACFKGYQAWIGDGEHSGYMEWNIVSSIKSNALTLMFPTTHTHVNGERVLCGNVGISLGSNTTGIFVSPAHIESYGIGIDCQDCQDVTIDHPSIGNSVAEGGIAGDGIRLDSVRQALIVNPVINGFANAIHVTSRRPPWGSAFGVNVVGYSCETAACGGNPGNTNDGIVNNSGADPTQYGIGCNNTYPSFNLAINCSEATGPVRSLPFAEGSAPTAHSGYDLCYGDSTLHGLKCSFDGSSYTPLGSLPGLYTVSSGTGHPALPSASSYPGATAIVVDAATFSVGTCTGGGSDTMIAVSNGSAWSCH
jgi:hypothetical protein